MAKGKKKLTAAQEFKERYRQGELFEEEHFTKSADGTWQEAVSDSLRDAYDLLQDVDSNAYEGPVDAPWSQLDWSAARSYLRKHPDAKIEVLFPTAYAEDDTKKITNLATAETLGAISHRRMSEQISIELDMPNYSYDEEMEQIQQEKPPQPALPGPAADPVTARMLGPLAGMTAPDAEPRRQAVSDMRQDSREARKWKSEAEVLARELEKTRTKLEESEKRLSEKLVESAKPVELVSVIRDPESGLITHAVKEAVALRESNDAPK